MNDAGVRGAFMKVAVEELEACKRRLAVEAPADVVQKEMDPLVRKLNAGG